MGPLVGRRGPVSNLGMGFCGTKQRHGAEHNSLEPNAEAFKGIYKGTQRQRKHSDIAYIVGEGAFVGSFFGTYQLGGGVCVEHGFFV